MKQNLKDTTFLILIRIDTIERVENVLVVTQFLLKHFETNVEVLEVSSWNNGILKKLLNKKIKYSFVEDHDPILFRTKYLNDMLLEVTTPFVSVWDTDVLALPGQILESVNTLRCGKADLVYPYKCKLLDTSMILRLLYLQNKSIRFLSKHVSKMKEMYPPLPVGGAFFVDMINTKKSVLKMKHFMDGE